MPDHMLWLDLETTGVDESKDSIIEVGAVLTDLELTELDSYSMLVRPTDMALGRLYRNEIVRGMHTDNGLLDALSGPDDLPRIGQVDHRIVDWLVDLTTGKRAILAGSGVGHFDRRFIKAHMPQLDQRLTHWCIDVGVIRRFFHQVTGSTFTPPAKNHRALDDVYGHLEEGRAMARYFREAEELFGEHT